MILKLFFNTRMIWMIFIKILKNTIQVKNKKHWLHLMIWLLICLVINKLNPILTGLFIRGRKLNISLVFITQYYFALPKNIRLNSTNCLIMKIPNQRELQWITFDHSSVFGFQDFTNLKRMYCKTIFVISDWCYSCIR